MNARKDLVWTDRAVADLEAIGDYISRDDPSAASNWVATLLTAAETVAASPHAGRRVPELGRDDIREVIKRNYRIVYRVGAERIEVLTVFEGHRRFPDEISGGT
jgi:toxin ParE1/3/4